jgi:6-phosphogluconolactonase
MGNRGENSMPLRANERTWLTLVSVLWPLLFGISCGHGNAVFCAVPAINTGARTTGTTCGSSLPAGPTEFLYVTSASNGGQILAFTIDSSTGALGTPTSFSGPLSASGMAASQNEFLYVSDDQNGAIDAFSIDPTSGALTPVSGSPFAPSGQLSFAPQALIASSTAVYANALNGITGFSIGTNGDLTTVVGSPYPGGFGGQSAFGQSSAIPANYFLYATNPGDPQGAISVFQIVAPVSGILTPVPGDFTTGTFSGPSAIVFDGGFSTPFVFVGLNNSQQIAAFSVDLRTGALTPVPGSPFSTGFAPSFLALNAEQNSLFVMNTDGAIYGYHIQSSGALSPISGFPVMVGAQTGGMVITPLDFLYVTVPASNIIQGYTINSGEALLPIPGSPFLAAEPQLMSVAEIPQP